MPSLEALAREELIKSTCENIYINEHNTPKDLRHGIRHFTNPRWPPLDGDEWCPTDFSAL